MSTKKLLAAYARDLVNERAISQANYDKHGDRADLGRVNALGLALALLHVYTEGEFGQSLAEQKEAAAEVQPTTDPKDGQR